MSMHGSDRCEFLGAHVTPEVKTALRKEADKQRTSMSKLVEEAVTALLRERGHKEAA